MKSFSSFEEQNYRDYSSCIKIIDVSGDVFKDILNRGGEFKATPHTFDNGKTFIRLHYPIPNITSAWVGPEFHEDGIWLGFMIDRGAKENNKKFENNIKEKFKDFINIEEFTDDRDGEKYIWGHKKLKDIIGDETNAEKQKAKISEFFKQVIDRIETIV